MQPPWTINLSVIFKKKDTKGGHKQDFEKKLHSFAMCTQPLWSNSRYQETERLILEQISHFDS